MKSIYQITTTAPPPNHLSIEYACYILSFLPTATLNLLAEQSSDSGEHYKTLLFTQGLS